MGLVHLPSTATVAGFSCILFLASGKHGAAADSVPGSFKAEPKSAVGLESLLHVAPSDVRVEAGEITPLGATGFAVRHPGLRAVVPNSPGSTGRISFVYRGPSRDISPLASGELRRQIGLKLRSHDTCNLLYIMWHIAPTTGIHVQLKRNPGQRTHAQCRDNGYRSLEALTERPAPVIRVGERHELAAYVEGKTLRVLSDGQSVWEGRLPDEVFAFDGPAGIRTDNGEFEVELWVASLGAASQKR